MLFFTLLILAIQPSFSFWPFQENIVHTPVLKFYPEPLEADRGSTLIYYDLAEPQSIRHYIDSINKFFDIYKDTSPEENAEFCDFKHPAADNKFCVFRIDSLGAGCSAAQEFGFPQGSPCIFLTLSKAN